MKLLKELYKELKIRDDWLVSWVQSYCCLSYCWSWFQGCFEQVFIVLKIVFLLDENNVLSYLSKNILVFCDQNIFLGIIYRIIVNVFSSELVCFVEIEEDKVRRILEFFGFSLEDLEKVIVGLYQRVFQYFFEVVQVVEEEVQFFFWSCGFVVGVIDVYMMLVDFCD